MALNPLSARMFPAWVESTHLESAIGENAVEPIGFLFCAKDPSLRYNGKT